MYIKPLNVEHREGVVLQIEQKTHKNKNSENLFIFIYFKHHGVSNKNLTNNELFFTQMNKINNQQKSNIAH